MWNDRLDAGTSCSFWHATIHKDANFSWRTNKSYTKSSFLLSFLCHWTAKSPIVRHHASHVLSPLFVNRNMLDCAPTRPIRVSRLCFVHVYVTPRPFYDPDHKRKQNIYIRISNTIKQTGLNKLDAAFFFRLLRFISGWMCRVSVVSLAAFVRCPKLFVDSCNLPFVAVSELDASNSATTQNVLHADILKCTQRGNSPPFHH